MISIVIPTYKRPQLLSRAIENVLKQSYKDIEVIIVSDGFDEETDRTMNDYKDNQKVHYYYYPENRGGNFARNFGIKKSTGEYIAFLDDDDLWDRKKLEKQLAVFNSDNEIGLVYTGKKSVYPNLKISYINNPKVTGDLSEKIFFENYIGSTSNVMVKTKILEKSGLFDESLMAMQDRDLWIRICQITKIGAVSEPLLFYFNDFSDGQISKNIGKRIKATNRIIEKYQYIFNKKPNLKHIFEKRAIEEILRTAQRNKDKKVLGLYTTKYLEKYNSIESRLFILSTKIPFNKLLQIRAFKDRIIKK